MSRDDDALYYFQAHGLEVRSPEALNRALAEAIEIQPAMFPGRPSEMMSEAELRAFGEIGIDVDDAGQGPDPVTEGIVEFAKVIETALTAQEAATRLGVSRSRIRQRLATRELFSFRLNGRVVIPAFQFQDDGLVPGIAQVNRALPLTRHPLSVVRWFHTPQPELAAEAGGTLTPLQWLTQGRDPLTLCELASRFHEYP